MKTFLISIFCFVQFGLLAQEKTTEEVYGHHVQAFLDQDVDEIMKDYSENSVLITPDGEIHKGLEEIRATFDYAFPAIFPPQTRLDVSKEVIEGEVVFVTYTATDEATGEMYMPFATDTFIIENGKIKFQTVAAVMSPE
ncbi:nuclear transport factor 2 family protein [Salinimicrobium gaetbulicola]|uniref:Nuclear transport factor 2 family protein n=1 Tax=Salinimicrobium gaetbulicola TaxID=999702 RepID=A0ABW3IBH9_9FLAO